MEKFIKSENIKWEKEFPESLQREIAQNMVPSIMEGAKKTYDNHSRGLIPKDPARAVLWVFVGPFAKIGARQAEARHALDAGSAYEVRALAQLNPLKKGGSINLSKKDINDIGVVIGELLVNHALADRDFSTMQPNRGNLGRMRNAWAIESKDKLLLLDTVLSTFTPNKD